MRELGACLGLHRLVKSQWVCVAMGGVVTDYIGTYERHRVIIGVHLPVAGVPPGYQAHISLQRQRRQVDERKVLESFSERLRAVGFTCALWQPVPSRVPLGHTVASGQVCPQSGWWESIDAHRRPDGVRREFVIGQTMPEAAQQEPPTLWQRLKGHRPVFSRPTLWRLMVSYDNPSVQ